MKTILSQDYWHKVVPPIMFILSLLAFAWMISLKQPERTLVFTCTQSPDGVCFREEYNGEDGHCYTSSGVQLGYCNVRDYLPIGGKVCDTRVDDCPIVYKKERIHELARERKGLVVFSTPVPGGIEKAYCHDTLKGEKCYTMAGRYIGSGSYDQYANPEFAICRPGYGEDCPLVPAMIDNTY